MPRVPSFWGGLSSTNQKVVEHIWSTNDFGENHRINGPQVVYGAVRLPNGNLAQVQLQPGTLGYQRAVAATDFRTNGSPAVYSPDGAVVFQPNNVPLKAP